MYHEPFTMYNVDPVGTNSDSELPSMYRVDILSQGNHPTKIIWDGCGISSPIDGEQRVVLATEN